MARVLKDFVFRPLLNRAAQIHDDHIVSHMAHDRKVMANEQIRQLHLLLKVHQQVQDRRLDRQIKRRDGLIQHQHLRVQHQRPRHRDPLTLTAREHMRVAVVVFRPQTDKAQHLARLFLALLLGHVLAVDHQRLLQDRADLLARVKRAVGVLKHDLNMLA